ncbi:histone-lysine N-methyltransferase SETMAR [Trichonephila clavipes]|nr:histone-lysine N-methyltransferase SETMAR [Trichonephila clavipes]
MTPERAPPSHKREDLKSRIIYRHQALYTIRYEEEGDDMLSRIVTGDETWVSHITLESKQQSMEWRHTSFPVKVKAKQTLSKHKIMATGFWNRRGVLLVNFKPQGTTISSGAY